MNTPQIFALAGAILALSAAGVGQTAAEPPSRHTAEQRLELFESYLERRAAEITRSTLSEVHSLEDWRRRRPVLERQVRYMLGLDPEPERTPLRARVTGAVDRPTHRIEKIVFESLPQLYVTANLYLPRDASGPLPTVLYLSGHSPSPYGAKVDYQHHGVWFARHGFAAFLLDTIEFGELSGIHHGTHNLRMWDWLSRGYTPAGPETWNAIRAIDYLETRPEVDTGRLAVTGISGGGAISWYTAAVDSRIDVAAPVCATWSLEHQAALDSVHENCDCIYYHNTFGVDLSAIGALIAPRPLKFLNAIRDPMFPPAGYREIASRLEPIYELHGAAERLAEYEHDAPHSDILPFRKEADEWINRWLRNEDEPFDEGQIDREEGPTLAVLDELPADAINGSVHETFVPLHQIEAQESAESWQSRRNELLNELGERVFRMFPRQRSPLEVWKKAAGGWTSRYSDVFDLEFSPEEGIRVQAQLLVPRNAEARRSALIYVKGAADMIYPVDWDLFLPVVKDSIVLVLMPRGVDYPVDRYRLTTLKRTAALVGATLESMQVWDVLRAVDLLTVEQPDLSSISVYGRDGMGVLGLYAAALDERITRVILENPPGSHLRGPALLNVLRVTDIPEAAALVAPREIVHLTPLPEAYDYTQSIYRLLGAEESFRASRELRHALLGR